MEDSEKIKRLEKEIKELEESKKQKEKLSELFKKRNDLKYPYIKTIKKLGKGIGDNITEFADTKNKEMEREIKKSKRKKKKKDNSKSKEDDIYEKMFGESELGSSMGF